MLVNCTYIEMIAGDITKIRVDAVVNAANSSLLGGGGVDGAIHRAGGPTILEACKAIGGCKTGDAVITTAGKLPAKFVIHTVGPIWNGGNSEESAKLKNCYLNSLRIAIENRCSSIAFPNISTGVYHFPKTEAARIAHDAIMEFVSMHPKPEKIILVCFDSENYDIAYRIWHK